LTDFIEAPDMPVEASTFGLLVENAAVGVLVVDIDETIYYANRAAHALLGHPDGALPLLRMSDLAHPDDLADMRRVRDTELRENNASHYHREARYVNADGEGVWVMASVARIAARTPAGAELISIHLNPIESQKRAERKLEHTQRRFEFALEAAQQGVWDHDHSTGESYHSPMWRRMRGREVGATVEHTLEAWLESIHPDDKALVREMVGRHDAGELERISYEFREKHRDGRWIWILSRGMAADRDENGVPTRIVGTDTDITELKRSEEQFANLSRRLELALSIAKTGVWEFDFETNTLEWDAAMMDLYGLSQPPGVVEEHVWPSLLHPEDREEAQRVTRQALLDRTNLYAQYRVVRPDGEVRHVRSRANAYTDSEGKTRLIGVNWDVTADVNRTEELRRANDLAARRNEELQTANAIVEHNALHDSLTGLPNRRYLDERLSEMAESCRASGEGLAVLHFDLDRFKQINDTMGHAAGDCMLMHAAGVLKDNVRDEDFVARIGGDEFVVVLEGQVGVARLETLANEVIAAMAQPITYENNQCRTGVSIGVAAARGAEIEPGLLLVNADIALYRAKRKGRNRYEHFTESLQAEVSAAKACADDILVGLEADAFFPVFQPQFDARTLEIMGAEALARWQHPEKGVLSPAAFLPTAEDLNVLATIDRIILEKALAARRKWLDAGVFVPHVSVNISTRRLRQEDLVTSLVDMDIEPGIVSFELLESIYLDEEDELLNFQIAQLRELGIGIDIDDFGTGHASIVGLLQLEPNRLKIARELVEPIVESRTQRKLVSSIIEIGQSLGIEVVAEGVETMAHADILADMGCNVLQGYAFGRPMTAEELVRFVQAGRWLAVG